MSAILSYRQRSDKVQKHLYQRQAGQGTLTLGNPHNPVKSSETDFSLSLFCDIWTYLVLNPRRAQCCLVPTFGQRYKLNLLALYRG